MVKGDPGRSLLGQQIGFKFNGLGGGGPALRQAGDALDVQRIVRRRVVAQVGRAAQEQYPRRTQTPLLQVHKRSGELDEALEEIAVRPSALRDP